MSAASLKSWVEAGASELAALDAAGSTSAAPALHPASVSATAAEVDRTLRPKRLLVPSI